VGLGTFLCFTKAFYNPILPLVMTLLAATLVLLSNAVPGASCSAKNVCLRTCGKEMRIFQGRSQDRMASMNRHARQFAFLFGTILAMSLATRAFAQSLEEQAASADPCDV
jgi:hypothetical protein